MRTWFITGTSTGFGRLLTLSALEDGDTVFATARRRDDLDKLVEDARDKSGTLHTGILDVTKKEHARAAAANAVNEMGHIDILVNNAGYGYMGIQEEGDLDEIKKMYEVNVFGLIAVTQAIVPHMRKAGSGTVVNLSSVAGRLAAPRGGFYQSTKWAVEALSQSLFFEMSRFGIKVRVIEPGAYDTDFGTRSIKVQESLQDGTSAYMEVAKEWTAAAQTFFKYGRQDPMEVIDAIKQSLDADDGILRVPVGRDTLDFLAVRDSKGDEEYFAAMKEMGWGRGPDDPKIASNGEV